MLTFIELIIMKFSKGIIILAIFCLTGCVSKHTDVEKYSGFLTDYKDLSEAESVSGSPVLRWVSPTFESKNYDNVVLEPIVFYPDATPTKQIDRNKLNDILSYANAKLSVEMNKRLPVVDKVGTRSLIFRSAITAVETSQQNLQFYEVMPISVLIAGTQMVTGYRTLDTTFYFEAQVIDAKTMKPVIKVVRKGAGETLSNSHQQLTVHEVKGAIDNLISDLTLFKPDK